MKNIFITGANKGIGFEMAKQLLHSGHHVILGARNEDALQNAFLKLKTENNKLDKVIIDISDIESIGKAAQQLKKQNFLLDVIINNAAVLDSSDNSLISEKFNTIEHTIHTNVYGALHVVRTLLPLLRSPGRIINVSSSGGSMSDPVGGWAPAYCISKTLLNADTKHLAFELKSTGISVNAVCPGWVRTDMGGINAPRPVEKGAETPVWLATEADQALTGLFFRDKMQIGW